MLALLMVWTIGPLIEQVEIGKRIALHGQGIERTLLKDRQTMGTWWDGSSKRDADVAILISPALSSRLLGWELQKEIWEPEEVQKRWQAAKNAFENGTTFVVRLSELDQTDTLDFGADKKAEPEVQRNIRWSVSYWKTYPKDKSGSKPIPTFLSKVVPEASLVLFVQGYEPGPLLDIQWYQTGDWMGALKPPGTSNAELGLPLGSNSVAWYVIKAPILPPDANRIEIRAIGNGKERIARFDG